MKKKRQEVINPQIDEEILKIRTKDELIDYLLDRYLFHEEVIELEYSTNFDVTTAEINANYNKLKELADKYKE